MTDASGAVVWSATYTPFGRPVAITGPAVNNNRFPGQYYDSETSLNYNYWRDYDPTMGRYVQSDPIGLIGGPNTFSYVGGNPLFFQDPFGLMADCNFKAEKVYTKNVGGPPERTILSTTVYPFAEPPWIFAVRNSLQRKINWDVILTTHFFVLIHYQEKKWFQTQQWAKGTLYCKETFDDECGGKKTQYWDIKTERPWGDASEVVELIEDHWENKWFGKCQIEIGNIPSIFDPNSMCTVKPF